MGNCKKTIMIQVFWQQVHEAQARYHNRESTWIHLRGSVGECHEAWIASPCVLEAVGRWIEWHGCRMVQILCLGNNGSGHWGWKRWHIEGCGRTWNHRGRWTRVKFKGTKQAAHCLETLLCGSVKNLLGRLIKKCLWQAGSRGWHPYRVSTVWELKGQVYFRGAQ